MKCTMHMKIGKLSCEPDLTPQGKGFPLGFLIRDAKDVVWKLYINSWKALPTGTLNSLYFQELTKWINNGQKNTG